MSCLVGACLQQDLFLGRAGRTPSGKPLWQGGILSLLPGTNPAFHSLVKANRAGTTSSVCPWSRAGSWHVAADAPAQVTPGDRESQWVKELREGFMTSLARGFSSLGSSLPRKKGLARAACRAGPSAASLQTENGKSKARKTPLIALDLAPAESPATFPSSAHFPFRHPMGS